MQHTSSTPPPFPPRNKTLNFGEGSDHERDDLDAMLAGSYPFQAQDQAFRERAEALAGRISPSSS